MDDANVILSATDDVSAPVSTAISSLAKYQAAMDSMASLEGRAVDSSSAAAGGFRAVGEAAGASVVPHRAAHQALALVSGSLVELAGGSAAAGAGVRVLDSIMFQMAVSGGAVSLGLVAVVAAAAGIGYAFKASADETKKQTEELDKMTEAAIKAVSQLETLDRVQKSVAGVGAGNLTTRIMTLKDQIQDLTAKMKENAEASKLGQAPTVGGAISATANAMTGGLMGSDARDASAAAQVKMAGQLRGLQEELKKTQHEWDTLHQKSAAYSSVLADLGNPLSTYENAMKRSANQTEAVGRALGDVSATMPEVIDYANKMGLTYSQAAQAIHDRVTDAFNSIATAASHSMATVGDAAVNAAMGVAGAWRSAVVSIIQDVTKMAVEWITKHIVMAQAAALVHEVSEKGIYGLITGLAAIAAVAAIGAGLVAAVSKPAAGSSMSGTSGGAASAGGYGSTTSSGAGGSAISSAQSQVTNNIVVNLPIQALDVSSISDIQLRSIAGRIGRVIAESAGQGQFSLVGA